MLLALLLLTAPAGIAALRGVVSFELDNVLWDSNKIRTGVSAELRNFLADRGVEQSLDVYAELERLKQQGSQYGMMQPGAKAIQKECLSIVLAAAGVTEESKDDLLIETLAMWLQLQDTEANRWVAEEAVSALSALKEKGFACCAITGIGDTTRTPVLAPLVEFTLCTYDFTVPADTMWDVSMQVAPAKIPEAMGLPWVHVGGRRRVDLPRWGSSPGSRRSPSVKRELSRARRLRRRSPRSVSWSMLLGDGPRELIEMLSADTHLIGACAATLSTGKADWAACGAARAGCTRPVRGRRACMCHVASSGSTGYGAQGDHATPAQPQVIFKC